MMLNDGWESWELVFTLIGKTTLLLLVFWVLAHFLRGRSAATRSYFWKSSLVAVLLLPILVGLIPSPFTLPILDPFASTKTVSITEDIPAKGRSDATEDFGSVDVTKRAYPSSSMKEVGTSVSPNLPGTSPRRRTQGIALSGSTSWPSIALYVWIAGAGLVVLRFAIDLVRITRLTQRADRKLSTEEFSIGLTTWNSIQGSRVQLLSSPEVRSPMTWGLFRPVILIPDCAKTWDTRQIEFALRHELAHIDRRDYVWHLLSRLAVALHWFNPLVWLMVRRIHLSAEKACDDAVIQQTDSSADYAQFLFELVAINRRAHLVRLARSMAGTSDLARRVQHILDHQISHEVLARSVAVGIATAILLAGSLVFALQPRVVSVQRNSKQDELIRRLVNQVGAEDPEKACLAAWSLGEMECRQGVDGLVQALSSPTPDVRRMAAWALGEIKSPETRTNLESLIADPDPLVREMAVLAVGEFECEQSLAVLKPLTQSKNVCLRNAAVWAIGEIRGQQADRILVDLVQTEREPWVKMSAVKALARRDSEPVLNLLANVIQHGTPPLRDGAMRGLQGRWNESVINAYRAVLADTESTQLRIRIMEAFGRTRNAKLVDDLLPWLKQSDWSVRRQAAISLGMLGQSRPVPELIAATRDSDPRVRASAIWALDEINELPIELK